MQIIAGTLLLITLFPSSLVNKIGGNFSHEPELLKSKVSPLALELIQSAYKSLDSLGYADHHTHVVGLGHGGTGIFVHKKMISGFHPINKLKFKAYMSASGIKGKQAVDSQYVHRLNRLTSGFEIKKNIYLLGFDMFVKPDGTPDTSHSEFYVPNEYVWNLSQKNPDVYKTVISVNPYRKDALARLDKWAARGVKLIKWLPNAMGIDASDPGLDAYYEKVVEHDMVILTHTGEEQAVEAEEHQKLGNPLLFKRPLDKGVKIIMAHCASLGDCEDLESEKRRMVPCFDLFLRMMDKKKYQGLLFGEISAFTQFNRQIKDIKTLMNRQDLHHRLVHGSDYPLPAFNIIIRTGKMLKHGFITKKERKALDEIYYYNPLLFDFVLKRTMKVKETGFKFLPVVFTGLEGR